MPYIKFVDEIWSQGSNYKTQRRVCFVTKNLKLQRHKGFKRIVLAKLLRLRWFKAPPGKTFAGSYQLRKTLYQLSLGKHIFLLQFHHRRQTLLVCREPWIATYCFQHTGRLVEGEFTMLSGAAACVSPWRSVGYNVPPPSGRGSPASWWSQSSGWAEWRCPPPSWRTARAQTSAGTAGGGTRGQVAEL